MNLDNYITPVICYGEILWDILPDGPQPGGAPLNVAYHLNKLGVSTGIISRIGNDYHGKKLESLLDHWGIRRNMLQKDATYPTSKVIARMNNGNEVSYEILFPVAWDFILSDGVTLEELQSSTYLVYGSLSSRNDISRKTLYELLETNTIKVLDVNLRPPFVKRDLLEVLLKKADIVKFNQQELEMVQVLFGGSFLSEQEQVKFIQDYFNIPEIIVTRGEYGAAYYKNNKVYHRSGTEVKVKDTIGSGDAFLAAFIANHYLQNNPQKLINNAVAMGAFIATKKGGCPEYNLSEYINFKLQIN